ncbi:amylo-alpha-1,6-glucosidase [Leifsonia shinshuensis]|uniref:Glycogen debranching protein n=1 Tax=Leifsonia shinshuensis TaxID=150026 RepID=A0A7G6YCS7_9MICO|nr:glycogen debranching protein [Leifsonia shinshuensis]QNE36292.1 glycogen debranching protein [Leifsonia shinshuensis]
MSEVLSAGEWVSPFLDLVSAPFTLPGSRILVFRDREAPDALTVRLAEYERDLDDCVLVRTLRVLDGEGRALPVSSVRPDRIEFGDVTLTFDGPSALSVGGVGPWTLEADLPSGDVLRLSSVDGAVRIAADGVSGGGAHDDALAATARIWDDWFARTPAVRADLADMTAFCWWVLGANIVSLPGRGARAVVPSKIGYVGLWQWDAYFIASGLRHGDPDLAREQLELAFGFPGADGQLPDVVHDEGILASSDDLPPGDRENLRRAGSAIADPTAPIPLTKPPLAAWALRRLEGYVDDPAFFDSAWEAVARSQDWWFERSDLDGDGMPEYGHPYSSGLDDSPVFDAELPVASPDLAAYLILQDDLLAARAHAVGDTAAAARHTSRASRTLALLEAMWDEEAGYFRSSGDGSPVDAETAVSLLPLLTGRLPGRYVAGILAALDDPDRFATTWSVPTVARHEPSYSDERMWRGPVWVNVNALLAEGLAVSGHADRSRALVEETLRLVMHGGGPHEYFNPSTGAKAPRATTAFGWSAALFVDLAVQVSA